MLPNFLIIGGQRCATGWLTQCLREHPDIYMAQDEPHFFDRHFCEGRAWWEQRYFSNVRAEKAVGEKTANYLTDPNVPDRILSVVPSAKLICCLRNPIDRLNSAILMKTAQKPALKKLSYEQLIECYPDVIHRGMYSYHLKRYFDRFPNENILITYYQNKDRDPPGYIRAVLEFLEVDPAFVPPSLLLQTKPGAVENANPLLRHLARVATSRHLPLRNMYSALRYKKTERMLGEQEAIKLRALYRKEIIALEKYLNVNLSDWLDSR